VAWALGHRALDSDSVVSGAKNVSYRH
jgi:hypothetical protein